jgi:uncharacterized membrane protein YfcA
MSFSAESHAPAAAVAAAPTVSPVSTRFAPGLLWLYFSAMIISGAALTASPVTACMMAVVLVCSAVSTIAGFAYSALAGAILFQIHPDPVYVVGLLLISSTARAVYTVWSIRRNIDWGELMPYLLGGIAGILPGVYLLLHTRPEVYLLSLGCFLVCYGTYALVGPQLTIRKTSLALDVGVGALGGITGALTAFPAPFLVILCGARGMEKQRQLALVQPFILIMQIATLATLALAQPTRIDFAAPLAQFALPAVVGAYIGLALYDRLTARQLSTFINVLLLISGIILVARAL